MFELFCKISFFLFMLIMYGYVTSTSEVVIIISGYILCVFSYYYFGTIKTAIDESLNYIYNFGIPKNNLDSSQVPSYSVNKKYSKVNTVNVPPLNNKVFVPICRNNNAFPNNNSTVFNCKFNNFILNGDLPSPIMRNGLSVESGNKVRENMSLSMQNMKRGFNNSAALRFRSNSQSTRNPFVASKKCRNNLDMETYMNVKSPGFTGRIVDKALESASYHIKYPAVKQISAYRFDKSTLRHLSKIPRMNSTLGVRIAPPEPISIHLLNDMETKLDNETKEQNFLHALKDSRKRNYSQEGVEKNNGTVKKSRKNDIRNFTISQYKRSLEDKSQDILEDSSKKRRDDYSRDATKMVVYAPSLAMAPNSSSNSYSKKRKSSKTDKSKNEFLESTEKCRRIDQSKEIRPREYLNEAKPKVDDQPIAKESKLVDVDQRLKQPADESIEDGSTEFVRFASGKILNRTNRLYRRKLNSNKIDPISVIASEPEVVGEITGADDVAMKEHLLQNLLNNIERKGRKDEKVIFYKNSIIEEVAKKNTKYDEPPQQVPNPLFTDSIVPNEDDMTNDGLDESAINFTYLPSNKLATTTDIHHSTPITSNSALYTSYAEDSIKGANGVITSKNIFGSSSSLTKVDNGPNLSDSGYDTLNSENSINYFKSTNFPVDSTFSSSFSNMSRKTAANVSFEQMNTSPTSSTFENSYNKLKSNPANENCFEVVSAPNVILSSSITSSTPSFNGSVTSNISPLNSCFGANNDSVFGNSTPSFNHSTKTPFAIPTQSFSATRNSTFALSNGFNGEIQQPSAASNSNVQFGSTSTSMFGSGDSNFFNPVDSQFNQSSASRSTSQIENKSSNYNFGANIVNSSNTFGGKDGRAPMQFESSFDSIVTDYQKNFSMFGNGENGMSNSTPNLQNQSNFSFGSNTLVHPGCIASAGFSIGTGGSSRNRVTQNGRNKNNR